MGAGRCTVKGQIIHAPTATNISTNSELAAGYLGSDLSQSVRLTLSQAPVDDR